MQRRLLILSNVLLLLLLFGILATQRDGSLFGFRIRPDTADHREEIRAARLFLPAAHHLDSAGNVRNAGGNMVGRVVHTLPHTSKIRGYGGPVPLLVVLDEADRIAGIQVLDHAEDPDFLDSVLQAGLLKRWDKLAPSEAASEPVDAVTGATISSQAIIDSVRTAMAATSRISTTTPAPKTTWNWRLAAGFIAIAGAVYCAIRRPSDHRVRNVQLLLNVVLLGVISGSFLSLSGVLGRVAGGVLWSGNALVSILLLIAIIGPLLLGNGVYCAWFCPLGSAQELAGLLTRKKRSLPPKLSSFRDCLVGSLLFLWCSGIGLGLMRYELFPALVWGALNLGMLIALLTILVISLFIPRPYCRLLCPTGWLLQLQEQPLVYGKKQTQKR